MAPQAEGWGMAKQALQGAENASAAIREHERFLPCPAGNMSVFLPTHPP